MPEASKLEVMFSNLLKVSGRELPDPVLEFVFSSDRRWRFDFAWPDLKIAVECEGGVWKPRRSRGQGRHTRSAGFHKDCDKYNTAAALGWIVLRFDSKHLSQKPVQSIELLKIAFRFREKERQK